LLFGNLFLGETLNLLQCCGVALTLVSIILINQRDRIWNKLSGVDAVIPDAALVVEVIEVESPQIGSKSK
jgi:hypothetical protein